jgi:HEAT repeat protein
VQRPAPVSIAARTPQDKGFPLKIVLPAEVMPTHPVVADKWFYNPGRTVAPGKSDEYHVSLSFGPAATPVGELCKEFLEHFRAQWPMTLNWPDRRPLGRIFLCNPMTGWKTNPRGYLFGKGEKNDVTTPDGLAQFKADLLKHADRCVEVLKQGDCQGVIVWDLEGAEFWHPMTYIGNPQELAMASPEMDRCADEFFKRFTDVGLKVGVCIRPTEIFADKKIWVRFWHRDVQDPVALIGRKIEYARKRWGCTIFYLDSNVFGSGWDVDVKGVPWVMPTRMIQELNRRYPDVLVIPEWELGSYYPYSGPYKAFQLGQIASNANAKAIWPGCFSVLSVSIRLMEEHWDTHVSDVVSGDILFWDGWYSSGENAMVKLIYREASYAKAGSPPSLAKADLAGLVAAASDKDPATRFFAVRMLGGSKDPKAVAALGDRLTDEDSLVVKNALVAFAQVGRVDEPRIVAALLDLLKAGKPQTSFLRSFAAGALGAAGPAAVKPLTELLGGKDRSVRPYALQALGASGTDDPAAIDAILAFVGEAEKDNYLKLLAARALGALKAKAAVDKLIPLLQNPDEELSATTVESLGTIGDARAVEPLIKLYDRPYHTVVVYRIRGVQDDALRRLTGQKLFGKGPWTEYRKNRNK